jgi:hypothetical protein
MTPWKFRNKNHNSQSRDTATWIIFLKYKNILNFRRVIDPAEIRILSIFSTNTKTNALTRKAGP